MSQNIIDTLTGALNASGTFSETYGVLNASIWEHPDTTWFIHTKLGYGGLTFQLPDGSQKISINQSDLFALALAKLPALLPTLAAAVADHSSGAHAAITPVTLTHPIAGVSLYYTTNGSAPTTGSTLYTVPIVIGSALTLKVLAVKTYWNNSAVTSFIYT